jgi:hypothetical protein
LDGLAMEDFGLFYGQLVYVFFVHLVYFMAIWYIVWSFVNFPVLVCCIKINLAPLIFSSDTYVGAQQNPSGLSINLRNEFLRLQKTLFLNSWGETWRFE